MSEEQQDHHKAEPASSGIAKMLMGKVLAHKFFSETVLFWMLLAVAFFLPIFFIPGELIAPELGKMIFLEIAVLLAALVWGLTRLRDGYVDFPKSLILLVSLLLVVQFVVAAFVSPTPILSFIGSGYDIGTVNSFVVLFLLLLMSALVFVRRDRVLALYVAFIFSGILVMLYHVVRHIFGPGFLDFGIFTSDVSTPVGKWNDMVSLIGGMILLVLSTLYFFPQNKALRIPSYVLLFLGLFLLLIVDFTVLWRVLFVLIGVLVAFSIYEGEGQHKRAVHEAKTSGVEHKHKPLHRRVVGHLPSVAVIFLFIALLYGSGLAAMTWGSGTTSIATLVGKGLHAAPYSEVVLTPRFTFDVVASTLKDSQLFGTGPNRFVSSFLKYKTTDINRTPFWDTSFDFGLGRIPTYFGTTGIIGTLLWLVFIALLFMKGRKVFALLAKDRIAAYIAFTLFLLVLYFWSLAFFYLPNISIFALAFLFTGALIAFLTGEGVLARYHLRFDHRARLSFVVTPLVIIVIVGVVASGVLLTRQVSSLIAFHDAQVAMMHDDVGAAEVALHLANARSERDLYQRALSNLALIKLQKLVEQKLPQEELAQQANTYISEARTSAERAVALDPTNFENYLQLGGVYDTLGALGVQNTTPLARENYEQALRLNPKSPRVLLVLARLEFVAGDRAKTRDYLHQALAERPNFIEAVSFLVQMEIQDKHTEEAIKILENAVAAEPSNFLLQFALGYVYYGAGAYQNAGQHFEAAVFFNPVYADAKYFLGLSYARLGKTDQAIQQFTEVQNLNPDNKEVINILKNLKSGRDPLDKDIPAVSPAAEDSGGTP